jgi:hypothetical protein
MKITPNSGFPVFTLGEGILFSVDAVIEPDLLDRYVRVTEEHQAVQDILKAKYFEALEAKS